MSPEVPQDKVPGDATPREEETSAAKPSTGAQETSEPQVADAEKTQTVDAAEESTDDKAPADGAETPAADSADAEALAAAERRREAREEALSAGPVADATKGKTKRPKREKDTTPAPSGTGAASVSTTPSGTETPARSGSSKGRKAVAIASGTLLVLATAAAAVGDRVWPSAQHEAMPVPAVELAAGDSVFSCAPTVHRVGNDAPTDRAYAPGAAAAASSIKAIAVGDNAQRLPGAALLAPGDKNLKTLSPDLPAEKAAEEAVRATDGFSGVKSSLASGITQNDAAWLRVQPLGGLRSQAAAIRTISQSGGDLAGLAAPSCTAPSNSTVLTGASTTVGHTAVLTVTNPSKNAAGVTVEVRTPDGVATTGAVLPFTLGGGETRTINLGGTARDSEAVTAVVESSGAAVGASINQSILRGTTPGGIDVIQGTAGPGLTQTLPGIQLQDQAASKAVGVSENAGEQTPQVQITDFSGQGTTAELVALGGDGKETSVAKDIKVPASGVASVGVSSLPAGSYTFVVRAEDSVVAGARVLRGTDPAKPRDVAYVQAAEQLSTDQLVAVPSVGDATLRLTAPTGAGKVSVVPIGQDGVSGPAKVIQLGAGTSQSIKVTDLGKPAALRLSGSGGETYASLLTTQGEAGIASTVVPRMQDAPSSARVNLTP
ncbi:DUF5719 family protein [Galactobacter caseinivorans]|uniref:Uncharacterized protein n=1 Tax=Galactobacter caseinivorans TaxID=2676123 RepID=A0A496PJJ3_9MICC|nr:DUF5719 family protein [Galactobacter caseinivorans]RKW70637.1 hypothetical protein DWQ67_05840 [Galactobacter caseinivorans]